MKLFIYYRSKISPICPVFIFRISIVFYTELSLNTKEVIKIIENEYNRNEIQKVKDPINDFSIDKRNQGKA